MTTPTPEALAQAELILDDLGRYMTCDGEWDPRRRAVEVIALVLTERARAGRDTYEYQIAPFKEGT